jgi:hypothetical protein
VENKKQSHHKNNYLVEFQNKNGTVSRALVNALDKKNALKIGLSRFVRLFPEKDISRARVSGVYSNKTKRIEV